MVTKKFEIMKNYTQVVLKIQQNQAKKVTF